jgi:oxepin-CoA hydrolase/3-oxo-5,6-dehydrosuberyl-CoA semialdehyde dehydrogenase
VRPTLIRVDDARSSDVVHTHEVFGPVASIMPYDGTPDDAAELVARGQGSLVASAYGDDPDWAGGAAFPYLLHGGPGRAGNGEELGGLSGVRLYQRRCALQGDPAVLDRILGGTESE